MARMGLVGLPNEILEQIICQVDPNTIASLAACNRRFHQLVHSNWRAIFLSVFDDPRSNISIKAATPAQPGPAQSGYDWTGFTARIRAANALVADNPECDFLTLIDVIQTAAVVPHEQPLEAVHCERSIVFPPLLRRKDHMESKNTSWLHEMLSSRGYPSQLTNRLSNLRPLDPSGEPGLRPEFEDSPQGRAFNKLTFLRGFIPDTGDIAASVREQHAVSRASARTRVYNTRYLMRERMWGPFQPLHPCPEAYAWRTRLHRAIRPDSDEEEATGSHCIHSSSIVPSPEVYYESDDDPDYGPDANSDHGDDSDDDDNDGTQGLLLQFLAHHGINFADETRHPTYVFPAPHHVIPDYAFLAAARIVIESNMRDIFQVNDLSLPTSGLSPAHIAAADVNCELRDIVEAMKSLDLVRMGGAPGFWHAWRPQIPQEDEEASVSSTADKEKGKEKECEGWDWAGVEGEWRRVVSWLDYRDLLVHNVDIPAVTFGQSDVAETTRIFPMTLRIVGYDPPPKPPHGTNPQDLIWRLPIIRIGGESRGTDSDADLRRVIAGTVRMVGDGAVRWSMTSGDATTAEWVTESVQVGDIGSAIGIIGLWTGADHSRTEPIGPCWAWKIS
ncbi:hypothetical protein C8F01DRAFT_1047448 [Mycena amicta]|nr:hypothetical protein C8F01DRAFT_1047448 [Mycena amicta]